MSSLVFWKKEQWQRQRFWRVGRYLWRRRYRPGLMAFRAYWQDKAPGKYWTTTGRRLWLSVFLFALAIGGAIWLDVMRLQREPDANALNDQASPVATAAVATPPPTSIMLFENFVSPKVQAENTPIPDRLPATSGAKPSPSPVSSSPVSPSSATASPGPSRSAKPSATSNSAISNSATPRPSVSRAPTPVPTSVPPTSTPTPKPTKVPGSATHPPYEIAWAHPSNYGNRFAKDVNGKPLTQTPIIVLHETVYSADSAVNYFQTPHSNEDDQASYHTLIRLDGTIVYIVPPEKRAYGAGNSVFEGPNGPETAKTHAQYPPSVNNFAYHISLETPFDGENDGETHSGYTEAQYRSLAWLVAQSSVPDDRITTHRAIDRSESRIDPRSFEFERFLKLLHQQRSVMGRS